ncbi:MAG: hypothetical protein VYE22_38520 [Myxococcota bacterium]|nr:hypothetical protein [Myxococcota bacterium]
MRRFSLFTCLALASCSADPAPLDATPPDAAAPDAAARDAGRWDAAARPRDASTPDDAAASGPTYGEDIHPLFVDSGCTTAACHGSPLPELSPDGAGLLLYLGSAEVAWLELQRASLTTGRRFVVPGAPEESELYLHAQDTNLPAGVLSPDGLALIEAWLEGGAPRGPLPAPPAPEPEPATCSLAGRGIPPLPSACLPRCSAETWRRVVACREDADPQTCQGEALAADETPNATLGTAAGPVPVDCAVCVNVQTQSCLFDACPVEMLSVLRCRALGGTCDAESAAASSCAAASAGFRECQRERDARCVAGGA